MHIPTEAMNDEFIYFSQVEDGVVSSGFFVAATTPARSSHSTVILVNWRCTRKTPTSTSTRGTP